MHFNSLYVVLFGLLVRSSVAHICDVCDCQPERSQVFSITCDCKSIKDLQLTSSMMMGLQSTVMVVIKNCQVVSIERNSFSQLEKLDTLAIQNCARLYLAAGAFTNLNSLLITKVQDISFGEMALMGAKGIKNIIINSSNITEIAKYSLYDVGEVDRFSLNSVNIGKIKKNAINMSVNSIGIENTKVNYTESDGFVLEARKVFIRKSEFTLDEPQAFKVKSEFQTRFLENNFKGFFQISVISPFLELFGNHFEHLIPSVFNNVQMPKVMNNLIYNTDYEMLFQRFNFKDFHDNNFICKCEMNLLNSTRNSDNYEILKNNYCMTNCSLSLFEFEVESVPKCMRDHSVDITSYCTYERSIKNRGGFRTTTDSIYVSPNGTFPRLEPRFFVSTGNNTSGCQNVIASFLSLVTLFMIGSAVTL